jgi:lipopolysaccharide/colanic/teichoic acid biosynthesis glycosyltransferase
MGVTPASAWSFSAVNVSVEQNSAPHFWCKRLIDLILASLLFLFLLPLMLLVAVAIKLDTPGPVFFVHQRVGVKRRSEAGRTSWEVREFPFYKFRSMVNGADQSLHQGHIRAFVQGQLPVNDGGCAKFKIANDLRITRVGRVLRRTSLDELPQLLNVFRGEMSLVGPRPVPPYEVAEYQTSEMERLAALPGITGLWQVNGRGELPFAEMMRLDREYVRNQSLWLDCRILAATIPAVVSGRGAK